MNGTYQRRSTTGRPRIVTDAQVQEILAWHASRQTLKQKARQMNLTASLLTYVIRTHGRSYKQPSPEQRAQNLVNDRALRDYLRAQFLL
jgi:phage terminase large subunit GpA-like protein